MQPATPADGMTFLAGGGECGALMRKIDWTSSAVGLPEDWPPGLRTLTALMLASRQPMFIVWGDELTTLYNDGYAEILEAKHPAMGKRFDEIWSEIWDDLRGIVGRAYSGEAVHVGDLPLEMTRKGYPEETHFSFSYTPFRDESGRVRGFFCPCSEITKEVLESRRMAVRSNLADGLRSLHDEYSMRSLGAELLGEHLSADTLGFSEADPSGTLFTIDADWTSADGTSVVGTHRLTDFGPRMVDDLRAGLTVSFPDVSADVRTADYLGAFRELDFKAFIAAPVIRDGALIGTSFALSRCPRYWTPADISLVAEVGERVWAAVERLRLEAARRESDQQLRLALEAAKAGVFILWSTPDRPPFVSAPAKHLFGFPEDTAPSVEDFVSRVHPEDLVAVRERISTSIQRVEGHYIEYRVLRPDGTEVFLASRAEAELEDDGETVRLRGAVIDISEHKAAEAERQRLSDAFSRSQALLTALAETTQDLIYVKDLDRRLIFLNPATASTFGQPREELINTRETQWMRDPEEVAAMERHDRAVIEAGTEMRFEETITGPLGRRYYLSNKAPLRSADGTISGLVGVSKDVTEQKEREEDQRREGELLRAIFDSIPVMLTVYDPQVNVLYLNNEFERLTGWNTQDAVAVDIMAEVYPDPAYREEVRQFMQSRAGWKDIRMRTRDGDDIETTWANVELSDERQIGIGLDISDRKAAERHKQLLINELNHRVKNTLAVIQSVARQTFRKVPGARSAQDAFQGRLAALASAHDLLTSANWETASLRDIAETSVSAGCGELARASIEGPDVMLPPKQAVTMAMVLHELCTNAVKYGALSQVSGHIDLRWWAGPDASGGAEFRMQWREKGGPQVSEPEHRGFGTMMIEQALAEEFEGHAELVFAPDGLEFCLEGHLPKDRTVFL